MRLSASGILEIPVKTKEKYAANTLRLLQFNPFEKQDLMALLRGEPVHDKQLNINQMALL